MDDFSPEVLILFAFVAICFGIYLLIKGGSITVDAATWIADKWGLSKLFIAATIIAFGTSAPELFISVNANLSEFPGIAVGNVIGSNIANILLVIGISSIVVPIYFDRARVRADTVMMIVATVILFVGMVAGQFNRISGLAMFLLLVGYVYRQFKYDHRGEHEICSISEFKSGTTAYLTLILGFAAMIFGSELMVQGAIIAGPAIGVKPAIIGMTVVALGTSLPELSTCIAAARRGQTDMIVGGIIGSNIFNVLSIIGLTALIKPLAVDVAFLDLNIYIVGAATAIFAILLLVFNRIPKYLGVLFFAAYLWFIFMQFKDQLMG